MERGWSVRGSSKPRPQEVNHVEIWRKNVSSCWDSMCKGPAVGMSLMCSISEVGEREQGHEREATRPDHWPRVKLLSRQ